MRKQFYLLKSIVDRYTYASTLRFAIASLILLPAVVCAQQKIGLESLIPPAPTAAELGKYGTYPVGTVTGIPEISFPLYEVTSGGLKVPISLSYHASGIQVNQKATDVGLGWSVMAGGTISRTVYGVPDNSTYGYFNYTPPTAEQFFDIDSYVEMQGYTNNTVKDLEPDLFAYNLVGKSGKFIHNRNHNFVTIPFDPIVITKSSGVPPHVTFKIVDEKGTTYHFDQTSETFSDIAIGGNTISSWHLTKMISADLTDTISFEYEEIWQQDEIKQQVYAIGKRVTDIFNGPELMVGDPYYSGSGGYNNIQRQLNYSEQLIKTIRFKGGRVEFNRITARKDTPLSAKMLDEIVVKSDNNDVVKRIEFDQDYFYASGFQNSWPWHRLKLQGFTETGALSVKKKQYSFGYDPTLFPNYGSFGIDYWGFNNGKSNYDLIPAMTIYAKDISAITFENSETVTNDFPSPNPYNPSPGSSWTIGSANREPSAADMKAGLLTQVTYPTGGYTQFDFEPHQYVSDEYIEANATVNANGQGIDKYTLSTSNEPFDYPMVASRASLNDEYKYATISIEFSASNMGNEEIDRTQTAILYDVTLDAPIKTWVHDGNLMNPQNVYQTIVLTKGHHYEMRHRIYGPPSIYIHSTINWKETTPEHPLKIGGGIRIKSIKNFLSDGSLANEETYKYGISENGLGEKLFNEKSFVRNYEDVAARYYTGQFGTAGPCHDPWGSLFIRNYMGISKYSTLNYMGSPILYSTVAKYIGNNTANAGKTVYNYNLVLDQVPFPEEFTNSGNYGSINNAWNQAELLSEIHSRKVGLLYETIASNQYEYTRFFLPTETGIVLKQHKQFVKVTGCIEDPDGPDYGNPMYGQGFFTMYRYNIKTGASRMSKQTNVVYDINDQSKTNTVVTDYKYENSANRFLTETTKTNSDGTATVTKTKYTQDVTGTVTNAMIAKNILSAPVEEKILKSVSGNQTLLATQQTDYKQIGNLFVRDKVKASTGNNPLEDKIVFSQYDADGNILEQLKADDVKRSYVWGHNGLYAIAEAVNAPPSDISYTSFEDNAAGGWVIGSTIRSTTPSFTGNKSYRLVNGNCSRSGLNSAQSYVVSFWVQSNMGALVNGVAPTAGQTVGGWTYYSITVSSTTSVTISGTGTMDELRLYPVGAQMTTYTYTPLVGVTSIADVNGLPRRFYYDELNRLQFIKDHEGNIVSTYEYSFKQE